VLSFRGDGVRAALQSVGGFPEARAALERGLARARAGLSFVTVEAPLAPLEELWTAGPGGGTAAYWPAEGSRVVGWGVAAEQRLTGLRAGPAVRWARRVLGVGEGAILCAAAFSPASVGRGPWARFPALWLVLPRWLYRLEGRRATVTLAIEPARLDGAARRRAVEELETLWDRPGRPVRARLPAAKVGQLSPGRWRSLVTAALDAIDAGRFEKLVPARVARVQGSGPLDPALVLRALAGSLACTTFAFRLGDATFLGATPERLVARSGRRVATEALAGTARRGQRVVELRGHKIAREHELVVRDLLDRLGPLCSSLERHPRPAARPLIDMVHLKTPIEGRLRRDTHVLELALRLHPTPAVSGVPAGPAVRWLERHEPEPRGWYAGFVGWFDGRGDGEMSVAIRSGLLLGNRARLYAGAGVVPGSTAAAEYDETALKQRPFLRALGLQA
jgi:salicylate biosynthesis isochorismate synthase